MLQWQVCPPPGGAAAPTQPAPNSMSGEGGQSAPMAPESQAETASSAVKITGAGGGLRVVLEEVFSPGGIVLEAEGAIGLGEVFTLWGEVLDISLLAPKMRCLTFASS